MKKQISVQNFSDEVAIISTPPGVAKSESSESAESGDSTDSTDSISNFSPQGNNFKRKARPN